MIIHNAGIGYREPSRLETEDGLEHVFQTNVLAPYLLTALVNRPPRLIYLSSGLHQAAGAAIRAASCSFTLLRTAPGEVPMTRLNARLKER